MLCFIILLKEARAAGGAAWLGSAGAITCCSQGGFNWSYQCLGAPFSPSDVDFSGASLGVCQASAPSFEVSSDWVKVNPGSAGFAVLLRAGWRREAAGGWWNMWGANSGGAEAS